MRRTGLLLLLAKPSVSLSVLASKQWPLMRQKLDALPCFTCANEEGKPLEYEVSGQKCAMFYAGLEDAQVELLTAREMFPDLGIDLIPIGLGNAYELALGGKAQLIPGKAELTAAGAPPGAQALGQELPLFACMEISQPGTSGDPTLPLFMSYADCAAAVSQATAADAPDEKLEIGGLSLNRRGDFATGAAPEQPPTHLPRLGHCVFGGPCRFRSTLTRVSSHPDAVCASGSTASRTTRSPSSRHRARSTSSRTISRILAAWLR